jgi:hypothetical protein
VEENCETVEGEALYHEGVHLHASWLAQVLLDPQVHDLVVLRHSHCREALR